MGGGPWIVHEGFLLVKAHGAIADAVAKVVHRGGQFTERYFVLYMNRKLEIYDSASKENRLESCYLRAFCGWDGEGLLKAGESYGLELKLDKHAHSRMFVAAFNRVDLEKWCRGFVATLDPDSAAGQEVRRERRKLRKEEKRMQEEKEEKIRQWKEQQKKMIEDEKQRLLERELEILNMTPLERIDGLGSLDDDTARLLEKRRQRLQRRQAPTTRRVNKAAYRQRIEDAAGGKLDNLQPLQARVVEQRTKVRVEPPPPGQFIEAAGVSSRRHSNPAHRRRLDSTDSGSDNSSISGESRMSSGPFSRESMSGSIPPPPPPPRSEFDDSRSDYIPPPPPRRESRAYSVRSSVNGDEDHLESSASSHRGRRTSGVGQDKHSAQANLAAILGGRRPIAQENYSRGRHDSFDSTADSTANGESIPASRKKEAKTQDTDSSAVTNAFAASLMAIRRNRAPTVDERSEVSVSSHRARDRKRDTQLSAEGKAMLQKAIALDEPRPSTNKKAANGTRKGLFDDSSSGESDDSDDGLFGVKKQAASVNKPAPTMNRDTMEDVESDSSDDDESEYIAQRSVDRRPASDITSPRSTTSAVSTRLPARAPGVVDVVYKSCALQNQGKKAVAVYTFAFRSGDAEVSFSHSYHEFEAIHDRLSAEKIAGLPKFPSKHVLRNFSKPENMQKRAMEFVEYFKLLVRLPNVFDSKRLLFEFQISDDFVDSVKGTRPMGSTSTPRFTSTPKAKAPRPTATVTSGGASRATGLFGAEDTDSDADSDELESTTPRKPVRVPPQPAPEAEPARKKKEKPSRKDIGMETPAAATKAGRDRTRSRNSVKSNVLEAVSSPIKTSEPPVPKITGLPPRPNLFGNGRGDLLAAIRQGAQLKKVDENDASPAPVSAPSPARGPSSGGPPPPPPPPPPPRPVPLGGAGSVAEAITSALANRRIHVEYEERSDDSDDDWD